MSQRVFRPFLPVGSRDLRRRSPTAASMSANWLERVALRSSRSMVSYDSGWIGAFPPSERGKDRMCFLKGPAIGTRIILSLLRVTHLISPHCIPTLDHEHH